MQRRDCLHTLDIHAMEGVVASEGTNYVTYEAESKKIVAAAASTTVSIKAILDTPILSADGTLTSESEAVNRKLMNQLNNGVGRTVLQEALNLKKVQYALDTSQYKPGHCIHNPPIIACCIGIRFSVSHFWDNQNAMMILPKGRPE